MKLQLLFWHVKYIYYVFLPFFSLKGNDCNNCVLKGLNSRQLKCADLAVNQNITFEGVQLLSLVAKETLIYLGLAHCTGVMPYSDHLAQTVHTLFPHLEILDLS